MGKIQLKVYTYWNKKDKPEIRRLEVEQLFFIYELRKHLYEIYPALNNVECTIMWKDSEGDDIIISTDKELQVAIKEMVPLVRLHVHCKQNEAQESEPEVTKAERVDTANAAPPCMQSFGVLCDGCESPITAVRYKCTICEDYDLCAKCEGAGLHPEHFMLRIPMSGLPRTVIRAAIKRSRQILKTVASAVTEEHPRRSKHEKSSERKRRGDQHGHGNGQPGNDRRENRRPRGTWLETVAMYMNEFANLAGDIHSDVTKAAEAQASTSQQTQDTTTEASASATAEQTERETRQAKIEKYAQFMREYLAAADLQNISQPSTSTNGNNNNNEEMAQGGANTSEAKEGSISDKESVTSEVSSQTVDSKKDDSPDRVDDWTVINKEKDLLDACMKPSAPQEPTAPIGFNLPEEFQQRASVTQGQSIYPPLNMATAVLDPKEAEPATAKAPEATKATAATPLWAAGPAKPTEAAKPQYSAAGKPNPAKPMPRHTYHPMAHINSALEHMLSMGFTNDGGWLTQLLESKDGNIAAVLDLLTPVNPKNK